MQAIDDLSTFARVELRPMLESLLESPATLKEVADRSYAHDNGFVKIVLRAGGREGGALRLHVWEHEPEDPGNVHNHCWDFTSVVLAGELRFEEFVVDPAGNVPARHVAYVPGDDLAYELRPSPQERLRSVARGARRSGELYAMDAETLHRTWGGSGETITLLAQGARRRAHADVYVTREGAVPQRVENVPLSAETLAEELRRIIARLAR